ncbi:hypothetical protein [Chryseobacterium binzhouense]|uniref:hypothetical protein n=1 Tax=Chryseobacterium binzhouense TaxID=2593646 RepID=UPI00117DF824|nr:hypothetical protein [Chryseobacterium binzhouense]
MRFINTNDIEMWSNSVDCQCHLPHLIRKLILATADQTKIRSIQFPYGEDVQVGGYDGELTTEVGNIFVPDGESVWEFGTTNKKGGKANDDYDKRKNNPLGKMSSQTTYINVSAKKYRDKKKWADEKKGENFWRDVRYYDAIDIEQWLELSPTVEVWLAEKLGKPITGIYTLDEYWRRWSENGKIKIAPEILLGNSREKEIDSLKSFLSNDQNKLYIKSKTIDEATAFPLAFLRHNENDFQKAIVVIDNRETFSKFIQNDVASIILIRFKAEGTDLSGATQRGHKLIIPISMSDEPTGSEKIQLPLVSRDTFENGLKKMGVDSEKARLLTKNSGRNISVLKRLLQFDDNTKPKYLKDAEVYDILPILLVNKFSEQREGDREIIEKLSGKPFAEYIKFLKELINLEDSPVYSINGIWQLVSPPDTWLYFAKYITKEQLEIFKEICLTVLSETRHKYTIPLENRGIYFETPENRSKYSSELKTGLSETLAIISVFGEENGLNSILSVMYYVDGIVQKILENNILVWRSLSRNLMILAEASPDVFLTNLERIIKDNSAKSFFEEEKSFIGGNANDLPTILWCLDIIGWMPEHLLRVSMLLCELIKLSPEKLPTLNTPISSLQSLYRVWYPQTNANVEERKVILEILIKKHPEIVFELLHLLIDKGFDTAFHTPRPKWRLFSEIKEIRVTQQEVFYMRNFCIDNFIVLSENNLERILILIDVLDKFYWDKIDVALKTVEDSWQNFSETDRNIIYNEFRKQIGKHRSHPTARWVLPPNILQKLENIAFKFKSKDEILSDSYLFEEQYPEFIEGKQIRNWKKNNDEILQRRITFVEKIIEKYGVVKIFDMANETEHPYLYGNTLALCMNLTDDDVLLVYGLIGSQNQKHYSLSSNFIRGRESKTSLDVQTEILYRLIKSGISNQAIVNFLCSLWDSINLWKFVSDLNNEEVEKLFWKSKQGFLYANDKIELFYALKKLQQFGKAITFLNTLGWGVYNHKERLTSEEILKFLEDLRFENFDDTTHLDHYQFEQILELLYSRNDYDIVRGANIEMKYAFIFTNSDSHSPKNLYKLMSEKPDEYFGFLAQIYLPEDENLREQELEKIKNNPSYPEVYKAGWKIMDSFDMIPSLLEDGSLNGDVLNKWMEEVKELAKINCREKITDINIGHLLAKYPIDISKNKGFPNEIYEVLEGDNASDKMRQAFEIQISNSLGMTTRGAFDGGSIERYRASFFDNLFNETKLIYPKASSIFRSLRDKYLLDAKDEDGQALLSSLE